MGYLEQDRLQKEAEARELAKAAPEAGRSASEYREGERLFIERLRKRTGELAVQDYAKIAELLNNLPSDLNFEELIAAYKRQTGFEHEIALYARQGDSGVSKELADKLKDKGLGAAISNTLSPTNMYLGDNVKPRSWYLARLAEPQEPGVGIRFRKEVKKETKNPTMGSHLKVTTYENVYFRFTAPKDVVITGQGRSIQISGIQDLDDALTGGFRRRHKSKHIHKWDTPQVTPAEDPKWNMGG